MIDVLFTPSLNDTKSELKELKIKVLHDTQRAAITIFVTTLGFLSWCNIRIIPRYTRAIAVRAINTGLN